MGLGEVEVRLPGRGGVAWARLGGDGALPLLLLHGWTATADLNWGSCYRALAEDHLVVAPDHRGHGRGPRSRWRPFTLEAAADDAAALLRALGLTGVVVAGYSMGGAVAQLLWRRHPDLVAGVVLAATAATFNDSPSERTMFRTLAGVTGVAPVVPNRLRARAAARIMAGRATDGSTVDARHRVGHDWLQVAQAGRALGRFDSRHWIGGVDVPTAVVATERDRVVPPPRQRDLAARIPTATAHPVAGDHDTVLHRTGPFLPVFRRALAAVVGTDRTPGSSAHVM